jgi:hypothetical protein
MNYLSSALIPIAIPLVFWFLALRFPAQKLSGDGPTLKELLPKYTKWDVFYLCAYLLLWIPVTAAIYYPLHWLMEWHWSSIQNAADTLVYTMSDVALHSTAQSTAKLAEVPGGIDEPIPRVTAHEIGHAFLLQHRQDVINLMASKKSGYALNEAEIAQARAAAHAKFVPTTKENSVSNPKPVIPSAPELAPTGRPPGSADGG